MVGYTPDVQVTDDRPPLPTLPNREAAQKVKILCCPMDQVPEATGEWGEKENPGKGQEGVLSRGSRCRPWDLTPTRSTASLKEALILGSLCPLES